MPFQLLFFKCRSAGDFAQHHNLRGDKKWILIIASVGELQRFVQFVACIGVICVFFLPLLCLSLLLMGQIEFGKNYW